MSRKGICNCLVFYDLQSKKPNLEAWYNRIIEWLSENNQTPKRMGLSGEGVKKSTQTKTFKHYDKVLKEKNFKNIDHIWIGAMPPDFKTDDDDDSFFTIHLRMTSPDPSLVICFDDSILGFDQSYVEKFGQEMASYFDARYGIAYQRDFTKGPGWYAHGVIAGIPRKPEFDHERSLITKWFHTYGKEDYNLGDLRDIYPINFLSSPHLERDVDGQSLKSWILSSPDRGDLKQLNETIWSWHVPEERISSVREDLRNTGILLCI
jgi:hypothetical protein